MIDRGKRSKTPSEVKPVENINKNLQSFLEISPVQKEVLLSHKVLFTKLSFRELLIDSHLSGLHLSDNMAIIH